MSDMSGEQQDAILKAWKVLNLQADTLLKLTQVKMEPWKMMATGMAAGGAIVAAIAALLHLH